MKRGLKIVLYMGVAACMILGNSVVSFAGTWKQGQAPNENKWWYDFENGSYAENGWQWIDGNNDGVAECYYFDNAGWVLTNTTTPDGYTVNADGAWTENGVIQAKEVQTQPEQKQEGTIQETNTQYMSGSYAADGKTWNQNVDLLFSDFDNWWSWFLSVNGNANDETTDVLVARWAQASDRGAAWKALFDKYGIPYDLGKGERTATITFTTAPNVGENAVHEVEAAAQMMTWINEDGMSGITYYNWSTNADNSITMTLTMVYYG